MILQGMGVGSLILSGLGTLWERIYQIYREELGERRGYIYFGVEYNLGHSLKEYTLSRRK